MGTLTIIIIKLYKVNGSIRKFKSLLSVYSGPHGKGQIQYSEKQIINEGRDSTFILKPFPEIFLLSTLFQRNIMKTW